MQDETERRRLYGRQAPVQRARREIAESFMSTDDAVTVIAAEFHRNVGMYQDIALTKPTTITKNGRERTVLLSAQEYARLKPRDWRVIAAGELSERQVDAIRNARVPDPYADLDKEV